MKTQTLVKIIVAFAFIFLLTAFTNQGALNITDDSKFLILVERTDNGVQLECEIGCAWKKLSFSLREGKFQAVDQYGMSSIDRENPAQDENLANFLLNIQKTSSGINLEGKEGTAWTKLSISCIDNMCNQYIDQKGTTNKE